MPAELMALAVREFAGRATANLAHLSVRATPAGVTVPRELMTARARSRSSPRREVVRRQEFLRSPRTSSAS